MRGPTSITNDQLEGGGGEGGGGIGISKHESAAGILQYPRK
jgi:hypothetical protein